MNNIDATENSIGVEGNVPPGLVHLQTLSGHRNVVYECAWSPRGRVLVSVAADRTICRWDLQRGKPVQSSQEFYDFLFGVAWSPNGRYLATASFDKTVRIIYAGSGKQAHSLSGHKGPVFSVAWSRTSRFLASASDDKTVRLWDGEQKWKSRILEGHTDWVLSVAWSFQEHLLASGSRDKTVRVWDSREKSPRFVLKGHTDIVNCVAWSPNGRYLASASDDGEVRIWNSHTRRQVIVLASHRGAVLSVRFSPDGRLLATKSRDGTVQIWDSNRWQIVAVLEENIKSDLCNGLAFHPNKHQLATLSHDQHGVRIWQLDYDVLLGDRVDEKRTHPLVCPECSELIPASMVNRRRERGHDTLTCPVCDTVMSLLDGDSRILPKPSSMVDKEIADEPVSRAEYVEPANSTEEVEEAEEAVETVSIQIAATETESLFVGDEEQTTIAGLELDTKLLEEMRQELGLVGQEPDTKLLKNVEVAELDGVGEEAMLAEGETAVDEAEPITKLLSEAEAETDEEDLGGTPIDESEPDTKLLTESEVETLEDDDLSDVTQTETKTKPLEAVKEKTATPETETAV